jgi:hypothetical protein
LDETSIDDGNNQGFLKKRRISPESEARIGQRKLTAAFARSDAIR